VAKRNSRNASNNMTFTPWKSQHATVTSSNGDSYKPRFVDDPNATVDEGDRLLGEVMARGYPVADFGQQAADLSVNHPLVIEHCCAGHAIDVPHARGQASTVDLRQALVNYRVGSFPTGFSAIIRGN
jgi:hypothetical protein